jgi:hypothetical protein
MMNLFRNTPFLLFCTHVALFAQHGGKIGEVPVLPESVKISYPDSNPLREALKPLPETAIFKMDGYYLWDPSMIEVDGTFHLFCSRWPAEKGMIGWKQSHVIRATSKSMLGPFQFQEIVMHPADHPWATEGVHNPKITKAGNKYLIYHLGIPGWNTGFAFSSSVNGPWKTLEHPVIGTNNPAIWVREDESAYAVGKFKPKKTIDGKWDACMRAFEAEHFMGPYSLIKDTLNRLPGNFELEDPTIWWANDQYNVICTDWEGKVTGTEKAIVYYTSKDGEYYELYSQIPVWSQKDPIPLDNGEKLQVKGTERPQVYINEEGGVTALLVAVYPGDHIPTYVVIRPVDNFIPGNK